MRLSKAEIALRRAERLIDFEYEMTNKGYDIKVSKDLTRIVGKRLKKKGGISFKMKLSQYNKDDKFLNDYPTMLYDYLRQTYTDRQIKRGIEIYLGSADGIIMQDFKNLPQIAIEAIELVNDIFLTNEEIRDLRMRGLAVFCKNYQWYMIDDINHLMDYYREEDY